MKQHATLLLASALLIAAVNAATPTGSPYAGQESRSIKALSDGEINGLLAGQGMGFAKAAELNGYPGPVHVLELASELNLTVEQRASTEALFVSMQSKAARLGAALVEEERRLDQAFRERTVTSDFLAAELSKIGALQADLRGAHLEAHLAELQILTPEQAAKYSSLRGYATPQTESDGMSHHQHQMMHN
jgi:Spy/CpxP family protein refolding chaperone